MKSIYFSIPAILMMTVSPGRLPAHCEMPCGIYDDSMRLEMIVESIRTIEKSISRINELSGEKKKNYNQIVRWIVTKEEHAEKIQHLCWQYFMAQRVKPVNPEKEKLYREYTATLVTLHELIVCAMKSTQGTEMENVEKMKKALSGFTRLYLKEKGPADRDE